MPHARRETPQPPLVAHVVYRFAAGGLENGLVNLINLAPLDRYRHVIICLTDYSDFCKRIQREDINFVPLYKKEGHDAGVYLRFWRALRELRPDIVHTRNLAGLEFLILAAFAGVRGRIHGEHGRDIYDLDGTNAKYNLWRKVMKPFVQCYTTVSVDLAKWLIEVVNAPSRRVKHIYNGVDVERFTPRESCRLEIGPTGFAMPEDVVIGTVGRMEVVKDQLTLVRAFLLLREKSVAARERLRLVMVGEGSLLSEARRLLQAASAEHVAWLPGERDDIPRILQGLDLFVLPSRGEGISNTILEAMASALPVVATRVGGNPELVVDGVTGMLTLPSDPEALAAAIQVYLSEKPLLAQHGRAGRRIVEERFSMEAMVDGYLAVYDAVLKNSSRQSSID